MARYAKFFSLGGGGGTSSNNLQLPSGTILDATLRQVQDGTGTGSPLYLSTGGLRVGTTAGSAMYWDDTNNRLGVGTNAPTRNLQVNGIGAFINSDGNTALFLQNGNTGVSSVLHANVGSQNLYFGGFGLLTSGDATFGQLTSLSARLGIKGSGSTSATTSLLVQNSAGTAAMTVRDDNTVIFGGNLINTQNIFANQVWGYSSDLKLGTNGFGNALTFNYSTGDATITTSLTLTSTTKGFLPPRMTTTQKNAIASPATGLVVMDITTLKLCVYNGSSWVDLH
jgi:hypothetical protein